MCDPKPSSLSSIKTHFMNPSKTQTHDEDVDQDQELHRWPTLSEVRENKKPINHFTHKQKPNNIFLYSNMF